MMTLRLMCPYCLQAVTEGFTGFATIDVHTPIVQLAEDGLYKVVCDKGHESVVALLNLKFELLFEIGLNAIIDGYNREAVSSFASSLERFYEFYWRVVMHKFGVPEKELTGAWKAIGRLSERQIGAYIAASLMLTHKAPPLLNSNKEVPFRNNVIHNGYVPSSEEAISFGDVVMKLMNDGLIQLRELAPESLQAVYSSLLPKHVNDDPENETELVGSINVLTAVDVMNPPSAENEDTRIGSVADQFERILQDRQPHRMHTFSTKEEKEEYEKKADLERWISAALSQTIAPGHLLRGMIDKIEEITNEKLSTENVASGLGIDESTLVGILEGTHSISPDIALRLAAAFTYTTPKFWLTIQTNYTLSQAQIDTENVRVLWSAT